MATSIFHRMTGVGNSIGVALLVWWLVATANGPHTHGQFTNFVSSPLGRLVLFGFTVSLCFHLLNGLRHLFWDSGRGYELGTARLWSWVSILGSVVVAIGIWVAGYSMMGAF